MAVASTSLLLDVGELLILVPDFAKSGPRLIGRFVKIDSLVDKIIEDLQAAGLVDIK